MNIYSDLIQIPSWLQVETLATKSTSPEAAAQTLDIFRARNCGRTRTDYQQQQVQDIALRAVQDSQISMAPGGSWALIHQHGFRWQQRAFTSAWSSLPLHLQFSLSPRYADLSTSLSLPFLYHILVYGSGTILPTIKGVRLACVLTHFFKLLPWELKRKPGIFLVFVVQFV